MGVLLIMKPIVIDAVSPIISNSNAADFRKTDAGPCAVLKMIGRKNADANYMMLIEVSDGNPSGSDQTTVPARALASSMQGPWTLSPSSVAVIAGISGAPEHKEFSPS